MAPKKFRVTRFALIMCDPTRLAEVIVAFCNVVIPGIALGYGSAELPLATEILITNFLINERLIGMIAVVLGIAQIYGAGTDWYDFRGFVATAIFCLLIAFVTAYWWTGYDNRHGMWLMLGTIAAEMFLAWRCYHEKPPPVAYPVNGHDGSQ